MDDDIFLKSIIEKDLIKYYKKEIRIRIRGAKKRFDSEKSEKLIKIKNGIEEQKSHRDLVCNSICPFTENGSLIQTGFKYIRGEPLVEKNVPNLDFLLFRRNEGSNYIILGECKSSISSPGAIINETLERKQIVLDNLDYIKTDYLDIAINAKVIIEYVIVCGPIEANQLIVQLSSELYNSSNHQDIIIWSRIIEKDCLKINCFEPRRELSNCAFKHRDPALRGRLRDGAITGGCHFDVFPSSHTFIYLMLIRKIAWKNGNSLFLTKEGLEETLRKELYYCSPEFVNKKVGMIIDIAIKMEFLIWDKHLNAFKLKISPISGLAFELALFKKWSDYKLKIEYEELLINERDQLQDEVGRMRKYIPKSLFEYDEI